MPAVADGSASIAVGADGHLGVPATRAALAGVLITMAGHEGSRR
jgi:hypothetical protein